DASEEAEGARVSVSTGWDAESSSARVVVADNGVGIPPEDLASIFEVFASTKGTRGTGLGLPVSRKIAREHGGEISVSSEVGRGARFVVELPMKKADGKGTGEGFETMG